MSDSTHIIVIGAGLIGLSCADSLSRRGTKVTVIERKKTPVRGTSYSNSGMIHPSQSYDWSKDLIDAAHPAKDVYELAKRSAKLLAENIKYLGLKHRPEGCVQIFDSLDIAIQQARNYEALGVECHVTEGDARSLNHPALIFPNDMSGNARLYGETLALDLVGRGVDFNFGVTSIKLSPSSSGWYIDIKTKALQVDHVIIAAGIWSHDLLEPLGLSLPLEAVKGCAINFRHPESALPALPIMDMASRSALTIFDDIIRISGGWDVDDTAILMDRWHVLAPDIMSTLSEPISTWSASRPVSKLGRPFIAESPLPKLWVNTGQGHMGWTLSAGSGDLMARMILDDYQDDRFAFPD